MLVLTALLACNPPSKPAPPPATDIVGGRTNVLLVIIDTLRADHVGCYGYGVPTTPRLDALCNRSVVFDNFYANAPWTRPSMGVIFTGEYARSLGIYEEQYDKLPKSATTLAERFKAHGYTTLGITANPNINTFFHFAQGFDAYSDSGTVWSWMPRKGKVVFSDAKNNSEDATTVTDRALQALDEYQEQALDAPFYLQLVYIDPHTPYSAAKEHQRTVKAGGSRHAGYDGDILYVDIELHRLLQSMEERQLLQDTLVIVTSDHGEGLKSHPNVPNSKLHGTHLYDSVMHIPFFVHHGALEPGRVDALASSIDIVPTVADLLGWEDVELPGTSFRPLLEGGANPLPAHVFMETEWRRNDKVGIRTAERKYVRNDDVINFLDHGIFEGRKLDKKGQRMLQEVPREELYDLSRGEDPTKHNLVASESDTKAQLKHLIEEWEGLTPRRDPIGRSKKDALSLPDGTVVPVAGDGEEGELDEATKALLRKLGYQD